MELAKNLDKACKAKGLRITQLARLTGVKQPTLHGWTTGRGVKNLKDLQKVCHFLGIGIHEMLFGYPDPNEKTDENKVLAELFKGEVRIIIQKI